MKKKPGKIHLNPYIPASVLFFLFQCAEFDLQHGKMTKITILYVLWLVLRSVLSGCILGILIPKALEFIGKLKAERTASGEKKTDEDAKRSSHAFFFISWAVITLGFLPYYLAYYPGICAYDAGIQIGQCVSDMFNEHHPLLHTLLLRVFWNLGNKLSGGVTAGIGLFVFLQMILLSLSFAYAISLLIKRGLSKRGAMVLTAISALYPYNAYIAISVTKAGLFSAAFISAGTMLLLSLYDDRNSLAFKCEDVILCLLLFPVMFFRNNARYAVFAVLFFCLMGLAFSRKRRKLYARLSIILAASGVLSMIIITAVFNGLNATQSDRREMLSIPIQQLGRAAFYHEGELTESETAAMNGLILDEAWREYDPLIADPIKRHFNTYYVLHNSGETVSTYLSLLKKYPEDFVGAVLAVDSGYLYVFDRSCLDIYASSGKQGLGFVQTRWSEDVYGYGLEKRSVLPGLLALLEKMNDENTLQRIPVLGLIFLPGWVFWAYVFITFGSMKKNASRMLPGLCLPLAYIGTLILGPTVQMRYLYPVWLLLPFVVAIYACLRGDADEIS